LIFHTLLASPFSFTTRSKNIIGVSGPFPDFDENALLALALKAYPPSKTNASLALA
jgi:hypothetical protein